MRRFAFLILLIAVAGVAGTLYVAISFTNAFTAKRGTEANPILIPNETDENGCIRMHPLPEPVPDNSPPKHFRVRCESWSIPPATNAMTELANRYKAAQIMWTIGEVTEDQFQRNNAVGTLDATIPMIGLPERQQRIHEHYSRYGSLEQLVELLDHQGHYSNEKGEKILTEDEELDLWYLASRHHKMHYLCITFDEYRQLSKLLGKLVTAYEQDANAPPEAPLVPEDSDDEDQPSEA